MCTGSYAHKNIYTVGLRVTWEEEIRNRIFTSCLKVASEHYSEKCDDMETRITLPVPNKMKIQAHYELGLN